MKKHLRSLCLGFLELEKTGITKRVLLILSLVFIYSNLSLAQNISDLNVKGITVDVNLLNEMSDADRAKLNDFNFDSYRRYDEESTIQLINGPVIKLASILDYQKNGFEVEANIVEKRKSKK